MDKLLPKMNLTWYKEDFYSDGPIEDVIINIIKTSNSENYSEALAKNFSWPTYYHLTGMRKNILNWYKFKENSNLLEIGCGMGAITSLLCDKCNHVTAVELSKRRAIATQLRCKNKDNLEIIVGNLNDIEFTQAYDYITLIGVLEYQANFTNSSNPFKDFLSKVKTLLKPDGKLLIAIENKYGIKYWCGAAEDHTGVPFDSINNYKLGNSVAKTFGKVELQKLLVESGFHFYKFYYPMPDYKLPIYIFTDEYMPKKNQLMNLKPYYLNNQSLIAEEEQLYLDLVDNQVFDFFSNSFLVECSIRNSNFDNAIFVASSYARKQEYSVQTIICTNGKSYKKALSNVSQGHIEHTHHNLLTLAANGIKTIESQYENGLQISDFIKMQTLEEYILDMAKQGNQKAIIDGFTLLYKNILSSSEHVNTKTTFLHQVGALQNEIDLGIILKEGYIDLISKNCFYYGDSLMFFDQEYQFKNIPAKYIIYRAISDLYASHSWIEKVCAFNILAEKFDCITHFNILEEFEKYFVNLLIDKLAYSEYKYFCGKINIKENIQRLVKSENEIPNFKNKINEFIAIGNISGLYTFFVEHKMHTVQDDEIAQLQKILEIYGYEQSKQVEFSFQNFKNLHAMTIQYSNVLQLLNLLNEYKTNEKIENLFFHEIKKLGFSIYAIYVMIECEFDEQKKKRLFEIIRNNL